MAVNNTTKWIILQVVVAAFAIGSLFGGWGKEERPKVPTQFPVRQGVQEPVDPLPPAATDPTEKTDSVPGGGGSYTSTAEERSSTGWSATKLTTDIIGTWEGIEHKPLPEVKIDKPRDGRKFKATPPDFNIKFRIPTSAGIYEGGCDTYLSGKAFCRINDPADPETKTAGKQVEGLVIAESAFKRGIGDMLRLNIPNGVEVELVRRPSESDPKK